MGTPSATLAAYGSRAHAASRDPPGETVVAENLAEAAAHGSRILVGGGNLDACLDVVAEITGCGEVYRHNSLNPYRFEGQ